MIMVDIKELDNILRLQVPTMLQPDRTIEQTPIIHSENVVQQSSRDTGSDSESETWSFDRAINEVHYVFRLLWN